MPRSITSFTCGAVLSVLLLPSVAFGVVTERISVAEPWVPGNAQSWVPIANADGEVVCFTSSASNLVPDDTNGVSDVFVRKQWCGTPSRASTAADGRQADGPSMFGVVSADGRYCAFVSWATNLVPGVGDGKGQYYRKDLGTGAIMCVSASAEGVPDSAGQSMDSAPMPGISSDGRYVCFSSDGGSLVPNDTNSREDAFVKDCERGAIVRASTQTGGAQLANGGWGPNISPNGDLVVFGSSSWDLPGNSAGLEQCWVKNLHINATRAVSASSTGQLGNGKIDVGGAAFSYDGRYVVFESDATNLVEGDTNGVTDIFLKDLQSQYCLRVSTAYDGSEANGPCAFPSISPDGAYVSYSSTATNLDSWLPDTNGSMDVFVRDLYFGDTWRMSVGTSYKQKAQSDETIYTCHGVIYGRYGVWASNAPGIVPGPEGTGAQVYVTDFEADPISDAKQLPDYTPVTVSGAAVSAVTDTDAFYLQQDGVSSSPAPMGILVLNPYPYGYIQPRVGRRFEVAGLIQTWWDGERYIDAGYTFEWVTQDWTVNLGPVSMTNKSVGGGDWLYDPQTGAGERGVTGGYGLNNVGALLRTWGKVIESLESAFVIDDGSGTPVRCERTVASVTIPSEGSQVVVTGISAFPAYEPAFARCILVSSSSDIWWLGWSPP